MATHPASKDARRAPLNRERVLGAAMELADEAGIESLTMRKLARELGVEAMSLYNHVANKGDLVDGIVDLAVEEIELPSGAEDWDEAIRKCAISAHEALLRHPWACGLAILPTSTRSVRMPRLRYMEWLLGRLREAGFSPELTFHAYHTLDSHIFGFTLWQLGHMEGAKDIAAGEDREAFATRLLQEFRATGHPYFAEHVEQHIAEPPGEGAREFEFALDLILDGLERARDRR
jgi:AcrR family transcriptional regulator